LAARAPPQGLVAHIANTADPEIVAHFDRLLEALDGQTEAEATARREADRLQSHGKSAIDDFAKRLSQHRLGNPQGDARWYSTDRSPRLRQEVIDGPGVKVPTKVPTTDVIAPSGDIIGTDRS
jgi:hypothetical protein